MGIEIWNFINSHIELLSLAVACSAFFRPELENLTHKFLNQIDFYPHSRIELGYFGFGPTIGIPFTIRGRGGNQFISSISLRLTRQRDAATYDYKWGLFRIFSASKTEAGIEENIKAELATAFLLSKDGSSTLNVQFHDSKTQERFSDDLLRLKTKFEDFVNKNGIRLIDAKQIYDAQEVFKADKQNNNLVLSAYSKLGKEFYWEEGKYKILIFIETDKPKKNFKFEYEFHLSSEEVDRLDLNRVGLIQIAMLAESTPNFVNPEIQKPN